MLAENQIIKVRWVSANKNWYIDKGYEFTKMWDYFYVKAEDLMPSSKYEVKIICDYCGKEYTGTYATYLTGVKTNGKNSCYDCKGNKTHETYMDKLAIDRYNAIKNRCNELGYILLDNIKEIHRVSGTIHFICPYHEHQTLNAALFLKGAICRKCAIEKQKQTRASNAQLTIEEEIYRYNNNQLLNKEDYINSTTKNLKILCGKCNKIFITDRRSYLKNAQRNANYLCPCCNKKMIRQRMLKNKDDVEKYINAINNNKLLNKEDYRGNDVANLNIQCGICGETFTTSLLSYQAGKVMCRKCNSTISHGELAIKEVLDLYNVRYKEEYWFSNCRDINPLPFDFYLPDYNLCIEYQGEQHYKPVDFFGGEESFKIRQLHDQIKRDYCNLNSITLIEIPYWEYKNIKNILIKKLGLHKSSETCA